jgi:hypothetical protein
MHPNIKGTPLYDTVDIDNKEEDYVILMFRLETPTTCISVRPNAGGSLIEITNLFILPLLIRDTSCFENVLNVRT